MIWYNSCVIISYSTWSTVKIFPLRVKDSIIIYGQLNYVFCILNTTLSKYITSRKCNRKFATRSLKQNFCHIYQWINIKVIAKSVVFLIPNLPATDLSKETILTLGWDFLSSATETTTEWIAKIANAPRISSE